MSPSLVSWPVHLGLRGAQAGLQLTSAVTDRALVLVGAVAGGASGSDSPRVDLDGEP